MSFLKARVTSLEARQRRAHPPGQEHFPSVLYIPPDIPDESWDDWLAQQPCACGVVGCQERKIGALLPVKCQTPGEWAICYGRQYPKTPAPSEAAELTMILTRIEGPHEV